MNLSSFITPLRRKLFVLSVSLFSFCIGKTQSCEDSLSLYKISAAGYATFSEGNYQFSNGYRCNLFFRPTGLNTEMLLGITNGSGNFLRAKKITLASGAPFHIGRITEAPNLGLVAYGYTYGSDVSFTVFIMRLDSSLNVLWCKELKPNFTTTEVDLRVRAIHVDPLGNIFASFNLISGGYHPRNNFFIALSPLGEIVWSQAAPAYFGAAYDFDFEINAATVMENRVYFLGAGINDSISGTQRITRPAYVGFVFDKSNGTLLKSTKGYVPYIRPQAAGFYNLNKAQLEIHILNRQFRYAIQEVEYDPLSVSNNNLITFFLDSSLIPRSATKLKGNVSGPRVDFNFGPQGELAVSEAFYPSRKFAVLDGDNNVVLSKNIGSVNANPDIVHLAIDNQSQLSLSVNEGSLSLSTVKVNLPLYVDLSTATCIGSDTSYFTKESITLITKDVVLPLVSNVVQANAIAMLSTNHTMEKVELCKIYSVCDELRITGDSTFCAPSVKTFTARKNVGCLKQMEWLIDTSTQVQIMARTDSSITVRFATAWAGFIKAKLKNCDVSDSLYITVREQIQYFDLGTNRTLCSGDTIQLKAPLGFRKYQWQNGDTSAQLTVRRAGLYSVQVWDYCGNERRDTVKINYSDKALQLATNQVICAQDTLKVKKDKTFTNYLWTPNVSGEDGSFFYLNLTNSTFYNVSARDEYGCKWSSSFSVTVNKCENKIWFPSAFTPNNDGKNDTFHPIVQGRLLSYRFSIYNRWGEIVFTSTDPERGWNGLTNNKRLPTGVFVYLCNYQFKNELPQSAKGSFVMIY